MKTIVVGITGEPTAQTAAHRALDLARALGSQIHFVTAVDDNVTDVINVGSDRFELDTAEQARSEVLKFLHGIGTEVPYTVTAVEGDPGKALVDVAEQVDADLIVVGNVRMQGFGRLLGSVGSDVVHHAPCDVLIVKTT
ncbi:MAG: universal stress protein [Acidimicrobiales bacterium]